MTTKKVEVLATKQLRTAVLQDGTNAIPVCGLFPDHETLVANLNTCEPETMVLKEVLPLRNTSANKKSKRKN